MAPHAAIVSGRRSSENQITNVRIGFVVQRCGREVNGGAESHCLQVARRMAAHWQTEVITTCALDYVTWQNSYPVGTEKVDGTTIRRFPVDYPRDPKGFDQISAELYAKGAQATIAD